MDDLNVSQNEVARWAGISSAHLSQIMNGKSSPSAVVLRKLHGALFRRRQDPERVMPVAMKVMGWKKVGAQRHGGARRSRARRHGQGRRGARRRPRALGALRWSTRSAPGTTAGGRCRWTTWLRRPTPPCSRSRRLHNRSTQRPGSPRFGRRVSVSAMPSSPGYSCMLLFCISAKKLVPFRACR